MPKHSLKRYIGDKAFYKMLMAVAVPIMLQNGLTNLVSLLDNIMVGAVGTDQMSGVSIVNQLLFVFNLCIFGAVAGPGILSAQFFGKGDVEGVRHTMRAKLYLALGVAAAFLAALLCAGEPLISLFLHESNDGLDLMATLNYGRSYLGVIVLQLIPFGITQAYSGTLRESGETLLPMKASISAVFVNLCLNYVLIFGKLGAPALGVVGAALATVIARIVECAIVIIWTHAHRERCPYSVGLFRTLRVPAALMRKIAVIGLPLLFNELLWSIGMTTFNQCYSTRGLEVVSALNIASTVSNLFICVFVAMGSASGIIVGQLLGAGELERAVTENRKLIIFTIILNVAVGLVMASIASFIPQIYNTTDTAKQIATHMLLISAAMMPFCSFTNAVYFTLRAGGKSGLTFLFDSGFNWIIAVPLAFFLSRGTAMAIIPMYACIQALELIKCIFGAIVLRSKIWVNNLVK